MRAKVFRPIQLLRTYRTLDEVIDYVHTRPHPLALYYLGDGVAQYERLQKRTTYGNVGINNTLIDVAQHDLPFAASARAEWAPITVSTAFAR